MKSSSQLLILGNGFDLHCGLNSSYQDFFRGAILDTIGEPFGTKQLRAGVSGFWESLMVGPTCVKLRMITRAGIESHRKLLGIKQTIQSIYFC